MSRGVLDARASVRAMAIHGEQALAEVRGNPEAERMIEGLNSMCDLVMRCLVEMSADERKEREAA